MTEGRFLEEGKSEALVEISYRPAVRYQGGRYDIDGEKILSRGRTDRCLPGGKDRRGQRLSAPGGGQKLAAASPLVQSVSPFHRPMSTCSLSRPTRRRLPRLASALPTIVDKKATIGTPDSFLKLLGSLFALSDKFTMAASLIAIIVAVLIAFKTMAGNIAERAREIGVLKAVGWTNRNVVTQLLAESVIQCFLAGILGLIIAFVAAVGLSFMKVNIPIPWDMSPTPHFLPGGGDQIFKTLRLPVHIPWTLATFAILLSVVIGGLTGAFSAEISKIKPSEVLRHE